MIQVGPSDKETGFVIDETPRQLSEFAQMCRYHESSAQSPFTRKSMCTLATPTGRITLSGDTLTITSDGEEQTRTVSAAERELALSEYFGIDLG